MSVTDRWVTANYVPKLQSHRLTLTLPALNSARNIFFLVAGADKAEIVSRVLGESQKDPYPVQRIHPEEGRVIWFLDHQATAKLRAAP